MKNQSSCSYALSNPIEGAWLIYDVGTANFFQGRYTAAISNFEQTLEILRYPDNQWVQPPIIDKALIHFALATARACNDEYRVAVEHAKAAYLIYDRELGRENELTRNAALLLVEMLCKCVRGTIRTAPAS